MELKRYLQDPIFNDALAAHRIAFINGPRQVGKTTMVESLLKELGQSKNYFNWDDEEFRKQWIKGPKILLENIKKDSVVVFDEIHKDRKWKSKLKGLYDLFKKDLQFIVTGSARLDYYRKSGESLQGRYIPYRLHPLSVGEGHTVKPPPMHEWDEHYTNHFSWKELMHFGGFPEPFYMQNAMKVQRWQRLYRDGLIARWESLIYIMSETNKNVK